MHDARKGRPESLTELEGACAMRGEMSSPFRSEAKRSRKSVATRLLRLGSLGRRLLGGGGGVAVLAVGSDKEGDKEVGCGYGFRRQSELLTGQEGHHSRNYGSDSDYECSDGPGQRDSLRGIR